MVEDDLLVVLESGRARRRVGLGDGLEHGGQEAAGIRGNGVLRMVQVQNPQVQKRGDMATQIHGLHAVIHDAGQQRDHDLHRHDERVIRAPEPPRIGSDPLDRPGQLSWTHVSFPLTTASLELETVEVWFGLRIAVVVRGGGGFSKIGCLLRPPSEGFPKGGEGEGRCALQEGPTPGF